MVLTFSVFWRFLHFLCFGGSYFFSGFIGFAPQVYEMMSYGRVEDEDDDQLYYTKIFLDQNLRVSSHKKSHIAKIESIAVTRINGP